ncbi:hypothetical protein [Flagellimonas sp.]|uniref:hypothetical protein n=1 Tax=Flagellimonas sp. TaxID=2058762 RepID=UPI003BADB82F
MESRNAHTEKGLVRIGCSLMCLFYLLGIFNGLVLETLHEVSHSWSEQSHHHSFTSDHKAIDYSSLEAMAGHSHEALEALKELLQDSPSDKQEKPENKNLKLDKHFTVASRTESNLQCLKAKNVCWVYQDGSLAWYQMVNTPPPQHDQHLN